MSSSLASGNSTKAGLPNSLSEINSIINEVSKDSRFTAAQERKVVLQAERMNELSKKLTEALDQPTLVSRARRTVQELMDKYEAEQKEQFSKSKESCCVCVDMDAFFASVECLDDPGLKDVPMAVGCSAMLSTSNYAARKFGVSAAMPGYIAMKLCPQLKIVPLRYERYREESEGVAAIMRKYDENLTMYSLDEAFLQLNSSDKEEVDFLKVVAEMRNEVKETTGLTCSAGIAANSLLAKLASNFQKPDGQFEINRSDFMEMRKFLHELPCRKLSGIGKIMAGTLESVLEVKTIGDLYEKRFLLPLVFKEKTVKFLVSCSIGHSSSTGYYSEDSDNSSSSQRSMSCERTFLPVTRDLDVLVDWLRENVKSLRGDVIEAGVVAVGNVGIKIKSADFQVYTRETKLKKGCFTDGMDDSEWITTILRTCETLLSNFLDNEHDEFKVRLIGVRVSKLSFKTDPQIVNSSTVQPQQTSVDGWLREDAVRCPICSRTFATTEDLNVINSHIDECLTKESIRAEFTDMKVENDDNVSSGSVVFVTEQSKKENKRTKYTNTNNKMNFFTKKSRN